MQMKAKCQLYHLLLWLSILPGVILAQKPSGMTFEQLEEAMSSTPKPIVVKLFTSWCAYCKMQDHELEKHSQLGQLLDTAFYYVPMDAETKEAITFNGKKYVFISNGLSGGTHQLAYSLGSLQGQLGYPAWVFLDRAYNVIARHYGFLTADELNEFLTKR